MLTGQSDLICTRCSANVSAVFVPKEVIKQQMQYGGGREVGHIIKDVLQKQGVRGLYSGYSVRVAFK